MLRRVDVQPIDSVDSVFTRSLSLPTTDVPDWGFSCSECLETLSDLSVNILQRPNVQLHQRSSYLTTPGRRSPFPATAMAAWRSVLVVSSISWLPLTAVADPSTLQPRD